MEAPSSQAKFPRLATLDPSGPHVFIKPTKCINESSHVARFLASSAYRDIAVFVMQLNRAMCPRKVRDEGGKERTQSFYIGSESETNPVESVRNLQQMLSKIASYIDEAPPDPGPRRFGNVSFRKWYQLLEGRVAGLLREHLPAAVLAFGSDQAQSGGNAAEEVEAYLLGALGSAQRLDYGTGHELSFLAFLGCLWKLGAFEDGKPGGDIERQIVLGVFEPYLRVVRRLITTYTLEPAGSHGVWGLDDHSFQPYIYGSAQLTRPITEDDPTPLEGSVLRAPKPSQVIKAEIVNEERKRNMYFSAIGFINDVKTGPFWEHSPILFDISGIKDGWGKINKGMIKMFNAEVLSKFPVVQHFPFGSLFSWDQDPDAASLQQSEPLTIQPNAPTGTPPRADTAAPWATTQVTNVPAASAGIPYSRAPGGSGSGQPTARPSQPPQSGSTSAQISLTKAPWA